MAGNKYRKVSKRTFGKIEGLLSCINPNVDFDAFHEIMGFVYIETHGGKKGLMILDNFAQQSNVLPTGSALKTIWNDYSADDERYFGMASLMALAKYPAEAVEVCDHN
jgi:hypothetical protein